MYDYKGEITGMIHREGEGLVRRDGAADWEVCKGVADDVVTELIQPLLAVNAELLEVLKIAEQWFLDFVDDKEPYNERPAADLYTIMHEAINKAGGK